MSAKPWADPRRPLDERLAAAEVAIANVDTAAARIAIMRELVEGADAYARGKADGADEAATAAVEVLHRLRADGEGSPR